MPKLAVKPIKKTKSTVAMNTMKQIDRHEMIACEAYVRAEQRGFQGDPVVDWLEAEAEIDSFLQGRKAS